MLREWHATGRGRMQLGAVGAYAVKEAAAQLEYCAETLFGTYRQRLCVPCGPSTEGPLVWGPVRRVSR